MVAKSLILIIFIFSLQGAGNVYAKVFLTKGKALELVFPEAEEIEKRHLFLTKRQAERVRAMAKVEVDSRLYTFYIAKSDGKETGYAVIDTHTLRTLTETVMFVINPDGTLRHAETLAFFEPTDYMPSGKWINLFLGKTSMDKMKLGKAVPNITGATISAESFSRATRRVLSVYRIMFGIPADSGLSTRER
ncbi:MAG: FMN-binding protein [Candidatus Dadabacteria bacterium]|nr:FMN-binding protein [Candidatus Dadabacteria bacterium]MCY4262506.1 FMN-binding protein [Candidatus Dadabacteria bacterium]